MEVRTISGQVCSVGEIEIELLIDGFRGTRTLTINDDTPAGFKCDDALFTAEVLAVALQYDARGLQWKDFRDVKFQMAGQDFTGEM